MDFPPDLTLGDPSGEVVAASEFAAHLGGIDAAPAADQIALMISAATQFVEQALVYSFRSRTVVANVRGASSALLPWGEASNVLVSDADLRSVPDADFEVWREFRRVDCVSVPGHTAFTVTYDVGSEGPYPDIVKMAVLRVAASVWHNRQAEPANVRGLARQDVFSNFAIAGGIRRADVRDFLSDWT